MMTSFCRFLGLISAGLFALAPGTHAQGKRFALVVGNGAYQNNAKLPNPPNDADGVAAALKPAWQVTLVRDASAKELRQALRLFAEAAQGADAAIVFFAGHGMEVKGENYLLPVDCVLATEDDLDAEAVSLAKVLKSLTDAGVRLKTIVLDCCRDNPLRSTRSWLKQRGGSGMAEVKADALPAGTLLVFSTEPGKTAPDGRGKNSPFTEALLEQLKNPGLSQVQVFAGVSTAVSESEPWVRFDNSGKSLAAFSVFPLLPGAPAPMIKSQVDAATKEKPYLNSLGMPFVPAGTPRVWFAICETRLSDFAAYAKEEASAGTQWKEVSFTNQDTKATAKQSQDHPVVRVSWDDAARFCRWLTRREQAAGRLPANLEYRLPTDAEWSTAVGLPAESAALRPGEKDEATPDVFPWGTAWPPPARTANLTGPETTKWSDVKVSDGFLGTAPVGSFPAGKHGLFDMAGNASEWCMDNYLGPELTGLSAFHVRRGSNWHTTYAVGCWSCTRDAAEDADEETGFRCVLADVVTRPDPAALDVRLDLDLKDTRLVRRTLGLRAPRKLGYGSSGEGRFYSSVAADGRHLVVVGKGTFSWNSEEYEASVTFESDGKPIPIKPDYSYEDGEDIGEWPVGGTLLIKIGMGYDKSGNAARPPAEIRCTQDIRMRVSPNGMVKIYVPKEKWPKALKEALAAAAKIGMTGYEDDEFDVPAPTKFSW